MTCKSCPQKYQLSAEAAAVMAEQQLQLEDNLLSIEEREARMAECASCTYLLDSHTCSICGCLVAYRAALPHKICPNPAENRWARV